MDILAEAKQGNRVFKIEFPDGTRVLFRSLVWERFNMYMELQLKGSLPNDLIEDAIFRECVLDAVTIDSMGRFRAGVVHTVASVAMHISGPADLETVNPSLEIARTQVDSLNSQIVMVICRAFPAYSPEDIEAMPWNKVLIRLAQAERILMTKNPPELAEPVRVLDPQEAADIKKKENNRVDTGELIRDGQRMGTEENRTPPVAGFDHQRPEPNPQQVEQIRALARRRQKADEGRRK